VIDRIVGFAREPLTISVLCYDHCSRRRCSLVSLARVAKERKKERKREREREREREKERDMQHTHSGGRLNKSRESSLTIFIGIVHLSVAPVGSNRAMWSVAVYGVCGGVNK